MLAPNRSKRRISLAQVGSKERPLRVKAVRQRQVLASSTGIAAREKLDWAGVQHEARAERLVVVEPSAILEVPPWGRHQTKPPAKAHASFRLSTRCRRRDETRNTALPCFELPAILELDGLAHDGLVAFG